MGLKGNIFILLLALCLIDKSSGRLGSFGGYGGKLGSFGGKFGLGSAGLGDCQPDQGACTAAPIPLNKIPLFSKPLIQGLVNPALIAAAPTLAAKTCAEWCICLTGAAGTGACVQETTGPTWFNWNACPIGQWKCKCTPDPTIIDVVINVAVKRCVVP